MTGLATAPYRHEVTLRIRGTAEKIRTRLPAALASLDLPFVIERPDELRDLVVALAGRLTRSARRTPSQ